MELGQELLNYGVLGIVAFCLGWFVLYLMKQHRNERDEWKKDLLQVNCDSAEKNEKLAEAINSHQVVLTKVITLIESRK